MTEVWTPQAVVLGAGNYPSHHIPLALMRECPRVVCCDGAAQDYIQREGRLPWRIVGDGDSIPAALKAQCRDILFLEAEQETNDQTKAVQFLLAQGKRKIAIVGATGKREDHTIGNISLLMEYMRMGAEVRSYTDYGVFVPCKDTCTFECREGQQVSIFNFTAKGLKEKGLAYPIYDFTSWWQGTLNKCTDTSFTIEAEGEYLVFLNY